MTIKEVLKEAIEILQKEYIDNPISKSKLLLASILKKDKEYLLINENEILIDRVCNEFLLKIKELAKGIPLQYITNSQEFMGMNFFVDENVLIPRPDTEILVEETLKIINENKYNTVIDMCTGSGAIAISIAKYSDISKIYAVDISNNALEIAKKNALNNGVSERIEFIKSDMFENIDEIKFDMIVSNPPYIETEVIKTLEKQVQKEPKIALDGGNDGLDFYRRLLISSEKYLNTTGTICMEIGYNQKKPVTEIFKTKFKNIFCKKDLAENDRVIVCKK